MADCAAIKGIHECFELSGPKFKNSDIQFYHSIF